MKKMISTKTHGMIDYAWVVSMLALPRLLHWDKGATRVLTGSAIMTGLTSLFTNYELGVFKKLPMKAHMGLDVGQSVALAASPVLFANGRKSVAATLVGLGLLEGLILLNSQPRPKRKLLFWKV